MKVEGPHTSRLGNVRRRSATDPAGGSSFADALEGETEAPASTGGLAGTNATAATSAILALQAAEGEEGDAAKERSKARAEELLKKLDMLRMDILTGGIPRGHLVGLAQAVKTVRDKVFDPRLNEILDEIDLRAQVELAKYDPYR